MRFATSPSRMLLRASCVALVCLLSASLAEATTTQGYRTTGVLCDSHSTTLRKMIRYAKSFAGPLAHRPQPALFGLSDIGAKLQRGGRADLTDDDAAIQNDAPDANIDSDRRAIPTLQPLELLAGRIDRLLRTRAFTPKSPRGPPVPA
jgi:hypothetical protein